ncbi:Cdc6/Cdc18 family protein [Halosolutus gelatinilyticus]|uniref:Cdc6/Cdc18 family protein n=1 Tax=Halosolutus gelatinilyticus TaxID=2931975 RepID=UPI001FF14022|nr:AAA family ATPase [Halosolutus gelatinilyticus]
MGTDSTPGDGSIFADERLLDPEYLPTDRFAGRDEEIASIEYAVTPIVFGTQPDNVLIHGRWGTGKTTCATYSIRREVQHAREQGVRAGFVYVDCGDRPTETNVTRTVAQRLNDPSITELAIPETGLSLREYRDRFRTVLDARYDVVLVVLDRMDRMDDETLPLEFVLSDADGPRDCAVGIIGICDGVVEDVANEAVESSLWDSHIGFDPYGRDELLEILDPRLDAFADGAIVDEAISRAASIASEPYGNARTAIDLLRFAGERADERGDSVVTAETIESVAADVETIRTREAIASLPRHSRLALLALASVSSDRPGESVRTTTIHEAYEGVCRDHDTRPRTARRLQDFLNEHADLGFTQTAAHWGGRGEGNYKTHRLTVDPEVIALVVDDR